MYVAFTALLSGSRADATAQSGIGLETALVFAKEGASIVCADINEEAAQHAVELVKKRGGEAIAVKADVGKEQDIKAAVDKAVEAYGRLDVMCAFALRLLSPEADLVQSIT